MFVHVGSRDCASAVNSMVADCVTVCMKRCVSMGTSQKEKNTTVLLECVECSLCLFKVHHLHLYVCCKGICKCLYP